MRSCRELGNLLFRYVALLVREGNEYSGVLLFSRTERFLWREARLPAHLASVSAF